MKTPKIVNAMNNVDGELIEAAAAPVHRKPMWQRLGAIAAAFALVLASVLLIGSLIGGTGISATVALDVNPSIELDIDKKEKVIEAEALNADARAVLEGMDLRGVDLNVAVNAIIGSMLQHGYISADKNSILVSVDSDNAERAAALTASVTENIKKTLGEDHIEPSVLTQSYHKDKTANKEDISAAKAALIDKITAAGMTDGHGTPYTKETLAELNIHQIKTILESKALEVGGVVSTGEAATNTFIGKDKALEIALAAAGVTKADVRDIEVEVDFERGVMVYDVDFENGKTEFEYEINAETGEIVMQESEPNGNDRYDRDDDDRYDDDDDDDDDDRYDDDDDDRYDRDDDEVRIDVVSP